MGPIIFDVVFSQHYSGTVKEMCDRAYYFGYKEGVHNFFLLLEKIEKEVGGPVTSQDVKDYMHLQYLKDLEAKMHASGEAQSTPKKKDEDTINKDSKSSPESKIINLFPDKK